MKPSITKVFTVLSLATFLYGCGTQNNGLNQHPTIKAENVLNKGNGAEPETLDPNKFEDAPSFNIMMDLYEGLTVEKQDNSIAPAAAESWDISKDGKTYTFHLRKDAKWSNGAPVTADDFVYSLRRTVDPKTGAHEPYLVYPIKNAEAINKGKMPAESLGVKALDQYTLEINLEAVTPYFLQLLAEPTAFPVYKPNVEKDGNKFTQPGNLVSNGAYQLKEWVVNDHITLVRNPYYWDKAHTAIETVNYYPTPDTAAELKQYEAGQIDYTFMVSSDAYNQLKQHYPSELKATPWATTFYYMYNLKRSTFKGHPELREALSMVIDREAIAKDVVHMAIPQYHLVPESVNGVDTSQVPEWAHWPMEKRIAAAKKLYAQAGYSKNNPLKIIVLAKNSDEVKKVWVAIQSMWQDALGVQVDLRLEEWKSFLSDFIHSQFDIASVTWIADYNDPFAFLSLMICHNSQNVEQYCNPQYDQLVNEANQTLDDSKREALYNQASQIAMQDYPRVAVFQFANAHLVKSYVGGYQQTQVLGHVHSKDWHIVQSQPAK
jgi:oligopeptide transport system substrate-binding protein